MPFAKTGGLADVCGALPSQVAALGHRAAVIMPAFRSIRQSTIPITSTDISFAVPMNHKVMGCRLLLGKLPEGDVPVWFLDQPQYFDRDSLYGTSTGDYPDNGERFTFFCRAALRAMQRIGWSIDIVHCNDWQTGLVPALLKAEQASKETSTGRDQDASATESVKPRPATVMTIHNLAYQGHFPRETFQWTGLDWSHFNHQEFEYHGEMNFLKTGIDTADMITTVSPQYSKEIRTEEHGCGLNEVLRNRSDHLTGIINGIDDAVWNPATDDKLFANYDIDSWKKGKRHNKHSLQHGYGLEQNDKVPMIGLVGRLAEQKGWDMILPVLRWHLQQNRPTQWIILGSGDARYEEELRDLDRMFPKRFALHIGFSDALAHQVEAASDVFVMPSHYEPCGLNQLYSLRYGTVPIVTPTGGLADTVVDCTDSSLANQTATGFYVHDANPQGLDDAIGRALQLRYHEPAKWAQLVETGMSLDWSWKESAKHYIELYAKTLTLRQSATPKRP